MLQNGARGLPTIICLSISNLIFINRFWVSLMQLRKYRQSQEASKRVKRLIQRKREVTVKTILQNAKDTGKQRKQDDNYYQIIIFNNIRESMGKNNDALIFHMSPQDIQKKIEQYLPVRKEEKDKLGEVFTPQKLIEEMMDKLPPRVWKDPNLKWLDPANGIGNFPMVVYTRLMEGLKETIPDKSRRSNHILTKMIYMCEINPKNVKISRRIFGPQANICCCDFLNQEEKWKKQFGIDKFDVIVGNPPFQDNTGGKTAQGGHDLYPYFFIKAFELLKTDGYLSFINPAKWRAPDKKRELKQMWDLFINSNPIYLKIYGFSDTKQLFGGGAITRIDYYVLQKSKKYDYTTINDEKNNEYKIDVKKWSFLPNYDFNNIQKIMTTEDNGIKVIYSSSTYDKRQNHMKITKTTEFKYPVKHSHTIKEGDIIYWSNTKDKGHFGEPKVILTKGLYIYPYNDYEGKYGMSNYSFGIPITSKKQGDDIVKALNTNDFLEIINATKWSSGFTDHNMFKYFKPDFYKSFLGKSNAATKIQAVTRGKQTRKKINTTKKGGYRKNNTTKRKGHRKTKKAR